jgi:hypothetical protein
VAQWNPFLLNKTLILLIKDLISKNLVLLELGIWGLANSVMYLPIRWQEVLQPKVTDAPMPTQGGKAG